MTGLATTLYTTSSTIPSALAVRVTRPGACALNMPYRSMVAIASSLVPHPTSMLVRRSPTASYTVASCRTTVPA